MYAFKVFTTTLIAVYLAIVVYVGLKTEGSGKTAAIIMAIVNLLSIVAIWG